MSQKKLLAISGSPHEAGITATMLHHAIGSARKAGYEIIKRNVYEKQIGFCNDCRSCLHTGQCVQKNDMQEIGCLLRECHAVILAVPVYWANSERCWR